MTCPYCRTENQPGSTRCAACTSWMVDPPPVREWTRARGNRMVAGVCRGLATRFGIPVAALRLAFVLSVLLGGWGILAYLALWIAMPLEPAPPALAGPAPAAAQGS
ncbi:MAG TPA: PspC domain-containing protein [Anaeromyxobacteraceae bacterium]|nr:PspC domain-containing protein [Anaeromyxobacteraceae bacterium]